MTTLGDAGEQYEAEIKRLQEDNRRLRVQLAETVKLAARYKSEAEQLEAARAADDTNEDGGRG